MDCCWRRPGPIQSRMAPGSKSHVGASEALADLPAPVPAQRPLHLFVPGMGGCVQGNSGSERQPRPPAGWKTTVPRSEPGDVGAARACGQDTLWRTVSCMAAPCLTYKASALIGSEPLRAAKSPHPPSLHTPPPRRKRRTHVTTPASKFAGWAAGPRSPQDQLSTPPTCLW